ncbi:MAG: guanylate kinase [Lachnospiraceae bacterium]
MENKKGILVVLSGFSGSGKGTIMKKLLAQYPEQYGLSISATTRAPRVGEAEGREYFFKTKEEFLKMIQQDELIEYAQYVGNYYGTPKSYVNKCLEEGTDVILEIETQGALQIKKRFPDTLLLFVTPPSAELLKERLSLRGTEETATILSRLSQAYKEADYMKDYDYLVINDNLEVCVEQVHTMIDNEHYKTNRNIAVITAMKEQLKAFSKGE